MSHDRSDRSASVCSDLPGSSCCRYIKSNANMLILQALPENYAGEGLAFVEKDPMRSRR